VKKAYITDAFRRNYLKASVVQKLFVGYRAVSCLQRDGRKERFNRHPAVRRMFQRTRNLKLATFTNLAIVCMYVCSSVAVTGRLRNYKIVGYESDELLSINMMPECMLCNRLRTSEQFFFFFSIYFVSNSNTTLLI
jgi:hypothetical protein